MRRSLVRFVVVLGVCGGFGALPAAALGFGEPRAAIAGEIRDGSGGVIDSFENSTDDKDANNVTDSASDPGGSAAVASSLVFDRIGTADTFAIHAAGEAHADAGDPVRSASASSDYVKTFELTRPARFIAIGSVTSDSTGSHCCVTALARLRNLDDGTDVFSELDTTGDPAATVSESGLLAPGEYTLTLSAGAAMIGFEDEGSADFDLRFTVDTPPPCEDTNANGNADDDRDGLCDGWEVDGIDADDDGTIDFRLPGAKRDHKDAYLEIDHMASHRPFAGAVSDVAAAFARAPVPNPDGTIGITLHAELGESVPESATVAFVPCTAPATGGAADFDVIKHDFFGTAAQRAAGPDAIDAKRFAYRYVLFAHNLLGLGGTSGCAELPGNDFLVTLGSGALIGGHQVGTRDQQSGTLMHELGHTFGLRHGGSTDANCKPNYLSIMSYTRQMTGSPIVGRPLDYSRVALPALNENALSEPVGVGGPAGSLTAFGPPPMGLEPASGPIDWDGDGNTTDTGLALDLNLLPNQGCDGSGTLLTGFDDWSNLVYDFQNASASADGVRPASAVPVEMTFEQAAANSGDADGDGVRDFEDSCQTAADAGQLDSDGDGIGDACDPDTPPGGPAPGGGGGDPGPVPPLPACDEDIRPAASLLKGAKGLKLTRRRLTIRGRAAGTTCRPVARVDVVLSRAVKRNGRTRCRFVTSAAGKLGRPRSCAKPVRIRAKGTTTWRLTLKRKLPRGRYTLQVRAADPTGARQTKPATRRFRVR